jgi:hypothetical protein
MFLETDTEFIIIWNGLAWRQIIRTPESFSNNFSNSFVALNGTYLDPGNLSYLNSADQFSICGWFKSSSSAKQDIIISSSTYTEGINFYIAPGNTDFLIGKGGTSYSQIRVNPGIYDDGQWHHVACVYDGTQQDMFLYIDGVSVGTPSFIPPSTTRPTAGDNFKLGSSLDGSLDEFAVFDYPLSATDANNIFNGGVPNDLGVNGLNLSPVGWWRMGDGTGDTNSGGGAPANGDVVGTLIDQGNGGDDAAGVNGPTFSTNAP